jgi:predicted PurR-regulated permease PerM
MSASVLYRAVALAAALTLIALLVQQLITLLLALALTLIIALPLTRAADFAQRHHIPRALGALAGLLIFLGVVALLGYFIIPSFVSQVKDFANTLPHTIDRTERYIHAVTGVKKQTLSNDVTNFVQGYTHHPQKLIAPLESVGLSLVGIATGFVVVIITALYIAISPGPLTDATLSLLPAERREAGRRVMSRIATSWRGWLRAIGIDMLVLGGLLYLGMRIIGLPFALGFAVFSAILTVIPNYGSIISAVPPILLGLSQSPGKAVLVLIVYLIVNQIEGNLILPLVMARTVDLHPAVVAIGVLVMAQLFGLIGVILSIPLLTLTVILVEELWIRPQETAYLPTIVGEAEPGAP